MTTKQEFYKKLKEEKLFSRYCMGVASAFARKKQPKNMRKNYEKNWLNARFVNIKDIESWYIASSLSIQP